MKKGIKKIWSFVAVTGVVLATQQGFAQEVAPEVAPSPVPTTPSVVAPSPLVTLVGAIDPKYSVSVTPGDLAAVKKEYEGLAHLPPVTININDLFNPGDEAAIRAAANAVSQIFLDASATLLDLRVLAYRLAALGQAVQDGDDLESISQSYRIKIAGRYTHLLEGFSQVNPELLAALVSCKSEICVNQVATAQRALIHLGWEISEEEEIKGGFGSIIVQAAVEDSYVQLGVQAAAGTANASLLQGALGTFALAARNSASTSQVVDRSLGSAKRREGFSIELPSLPGRIYKAENDYLKRTVRAKMDSVVRGVGYVQPEHRDFFYTHVFFCSWIAGYYDHTNQQLKDEGRTNIPWHALVYGEIGPMQCSSRGQSFGVTIQSFGPGLGVSMMGGFLFTVVSPTPIPAEGTWVGAGAKGAIAIAGAGATGLAGPSASIGALLMLMGPISVFAEAGIDAVTIKSGWYMPPRHY